MFAEKGEIFYRFLTVEDKDDVINLLANNFCIEEPICKCLNFSEKERYEYATYASVSDFELLDLCNRCAIDFESCYIFYFCSLIDVFS